jgi:hypothetical protein
MFNLSVFSVYLQTLWFKLGKKLEDEESY